MTREEAKVECERLQSQRGQASTSVWMTRETAPGDWWAVRVSAPGLRSWGALLSSEREVPVRPDPTTAPRHRHTVTGDGRRILWSPNAPLVRVWARPGVAAGAQTPSDLAGSVPQDPGSAIPAVGGAAP